jgi:rod shape determining protein RodA
MIFLNPDLDPLGKGYHIIQSKIAIGSGGMRGNGFLGGSQSSLRFPYLKKKQILFLLFFQNNLDLQVL